MSLDCGCEGNKWYLLPYVSSRRAHDPSKGSLNIGDTLYPLEGRPVTRVQGNALNEGIVVSASHGLIRALRRARHGSLVLQGERSARGGLRGAPLENLQAMIAVGLEEGCILDQLGEQAPDVFRQVAGMANRPSLRSPPC